MELISFDSVCHIISLLLIIIVTTISSFKVGRIFKVNDKLSFQLFMWHSIWCVIYLVSSLYFIADSTLYYLKSFDYNYEETFPKLGTDFIYFFTSIFTKYMSVNYIGLFFIYNFIGYIGLLALAGSMLKMDINSHPYKKYIAYTFLFLPTLSYWSVAIGKDAFAFCAVCLSIYSVIGRMSYILIVFSIIIMLLVRPHIAALMVVSFVVSMIFSKKESILLKSILFIIGIILTTIIVPFAFQYSGISSNVSVDGIQEYIDQRQGYNMAGGSSIDISSMPLPMQMFSYLVRPLPFEAHSIFALISSLDNMIIFCVVLVSIYFKVKGRFIYLYINKAYLWVYLLTTWIVLSVTTANLGIAMRQKWMFVPVIFILFLSVFHSKKRFSKN